jgi:menaquinone-specific isochorismate synthase
MNPLELPVPVCSELVRCERRLPGVEPTRLLALLAGQARGFWGRGDRWVAWGGTLSRIHVNGEEAPDRFDQVRREAARLLPGAPGEWASMAARDRPRFYGGFSFLETAGGAPAWKGFPAASFILPRVLLEGRGGGTRLVLQTHPGGRSPADLQGEMDEELTGLETALLASGPVEPSSRAEVDLHLARRLGAMVPVPTGEDRRRWDEAVRTVLDAVHGGLVRKAVLARILDVVLPGGLDPLEALRFLRSENARAHVFMVEHEPGRIFLGAAPEILAELRGRRFEATAVAGSVPRGRDEAEDRERAAVLLASAKDRSEHRLTAEEMVEVLAPRLEAMEVEEEPRVLRLARIQHLETTIRGRPAPGQDVLSLVEALHPTPAVCGRPRAEALALIRAAEPFDRGWYAGPVGWFDPAGDGDFVPALRSAVGGGGRWRLFAGAGIVAGSDPAAEWDETALKFEPALRGLAAGAGEP